MKKLLSAALLLILLSTNVALAEEFTDVTIKVDGEIVEFDNPPVIRDKRTMAPLRAIFEGLGLEVGWNGADRSITGRVKGTDIWLQLENNLALVNGKEILLDVSPFIIEGRTYVPVRFISEATGAEVTWINDTRTVEIKKLVAEKNIYTQEFLQELVDKADCNEEVFEFRNQYNSRRNGLLKVEGKYFDMYYPDDEQGKSAADFLSPHMDKVYMMLTDLYGVQAEVEVHLIHEEDTHNLEEGEIRAKERVTFIWLEDENDGENGINNISEFVHEINHNFFDDPRVNNGASNTMWINEAHSKLVSSLYLYHTDMLNDVDTWSFYGPIVDKKEDLLELVKTDSYLKKQRAWARADGELRQAQRTGLYYWNTVYHNNDLDKFKDILRNLGSGSVITSLERIFDKSIEEINQEMFDNFN